MAHKHKFDYFEAFAKIGDYAADYSRKLLKFLEDHYDPEKGKGSVESKELLSNLQELHEIEDASDDVIHDIAGHLANEFVTPIEREDIMALADSLDNVVDELDDVLQRMYMYHVNEVTTEVIEMARVVEQACEALQATTQKFTHYKKSIDIKDYVVKINDAEDLGDTTYIRSMHRVYGDAKRGDFENPIDAVGLAMVLGGLENCCDACEDVGDSVVMVLMKNT